jgi:hypothetical protein
MKELKDVMLTQPMVHAQLAQMDILSLLVFVFHLPLIIAIYSRTENVRNANFHIL